MGEYVIYFNEFDCLDFFMSLARGYGRVSVIKQKDFLLYYIGNFISGIGSVLYNFATSN